MIDAEEAALTAAGISDIVGGDRVSGTIMIVYVASDDANAVAEADFWQRQREYDRRATPTLRSVEFHFNTQAWNHSSKQLAPSRGRQFALNADLRFTLTLKLFLCHA